MKARNNHVAALPPASPPLLMQASPNGPCVPANGFLSQPLPCAGRRQESGKDRKPAQRQRPSPVEWWIKPASQFTDRTANVNGGCSLPQRLRLGGKPKDECRCIRQKLEKRRRHLGFWLHDTDCRTRSDGDRYEGQQRVHRRDERARPRRLALYALIRSICTTTTGSGKTVVMLG